VIKRCVLTVTLHGSWFGVVTMSRPPVDLLYASQPQPEPFTDTGVAVKRIRQSC